MTVIGICWLAASLTQAQTMPWGLTLTNINNPIAPLVATNTDGSVTVTAGGGDTYEAPDSFTYAYQSVDGDFDVRVRIINLEATDAAVQGSPKAALMARADLTAGSPNIQINALPLAPSSRDGQLESIGRLRPDVTADDLHGTGQKYGGDTLDTGACTYPDLWLRIRRQGNRIITYYANTNTTSGAQGTNGWSILTVTPTGTAFSKSMYVGLATVAHNTDLNSDNRVMATYASYGATPSPASIPSFQGAPVAETNRPGPLPEKVIGVNWTVSLPDDGMGYPGDVLQSAQDAPSPIIWNSGGFASVSRDVLLFLDSQTPGGFSVGRYQCGALDFLISPRDPVLAQSNLGAYTNSLRERFSSGSPSDYCSQAYYPTPEEGFVIATVRKNGAQWHDGSPAFHAASYIQLDGTATGRGYSPISGAFGGGHFYTRTTKLVTGSPTDPASSLGPLARCAIDLSIAYFPYSQGWKAGYFDSANAPANAAAPGVPAFKNPVGGSLIGDGYGAFSGAAVSGVTNLLAPAADLLTWLDTGSGDFSGLAQLRLPGVNAATDGMLFTVANDEGDTVRGNYANNAALPDGSGWYVAIRGIEESKADPADYAASHSSFSFLFVPFAAANLVGAHIQGTDGATLKGAGTYTLARASAGKYTLTIPGKTGGDGMLLLQNSGYLAGQNAVVDTAFLSYEYSGTNTFSIEARYINPSGADGSADLRDANFNFVWVDFKNPLTPASSAPTLPALSVNRQGAQLQVSWNGGAGFVLQQSGVLGPNSTWVDMGTQNPQTLSPGTTNRFLRLIHR